MALEVESIELIQGYPDFAVGSIELIQGYPELGVESLEMELYNQMPNDDLPIVDPSGAGSLFPFGAQPNNWRGDD